MTPVGCAVGPPITGQLTLDGIPVLGLVDTGASVTCLRFSIWRCYRAQWGPLRQFEGTVHSAHGKPLQIAGKTQHLDLQWGEARGRACFIVIVGLESPPCLIGMDIMRPLCVHIDITNGTETPAQPDPLTVHLNAAQQQQQRLKIPLPGIVPPAMDAAFPSQPQQQRMEMPLPGVGSPAVGAASPSQLPQQRMKMPLPGVGPPAVGAAFRSQTQQQRMEMPLPEVGSPTMGATSPSQLPQQRMEMPLPGVGPPAMGAAFPSQPQQQRMEMPLPGIATPVLPITETSPAATLPTALPGEPLSTTPATASLSVASPSAASHAASRALLLQTTDIPQRRLASFVATTRGPPRTFYFVPTMLLPAFVTGIPALSSGPELWIAIHNNWPEPLQLHSGQNIGVLEVVTLADTPPKTY